MRKMTEALALVLVLLLTTTTGTMLVNLATANPFIERRQVPSPVSPIINFTSPSENNTIQNASKLTVGFKVAIESGYSVWVSSVYYKASWQAENVTVYRRSVEGRDPYMKEYSRYLSLTGIPEGNQTVTVTVTGGGEYAEGLIYYYFLVIGSQSIGFTVDTTRPVVSILPMQNTTNSEGEVPLHFKVSEFASRITYVLDGKGNVTINGNTTLTELSVGEHNVTVYTWDAAGNVGCSETLTFALTAPELKPEPFPFVPVVVIGATSIAAVVTGLLLHTRRKRIAEATQT